MLIAGAAALGVVAGTCTGFLIQADREPTRLPSLSQPVLAQAKGAGPEPLSAAQDRQVKTDGDLRKLLLKRPSGARDWPVSIGDDGWYSLDAIAETYEKPARGYHDMVDHDFRRAAVATWTIGHYAVEIRLVQFHQDEAVQAADYSNNDYYWAEQEGSTDSWSVPGTGDGQAYVHHKPHTEAGYLPEYQAEAHAWRGDISMEIWITDTKPVPKNKIMDLAERQMERL
ncbi:hypothetical protein WN71_026850 [Streptomyces mangrovisoli]|uniref:Uncharacterized protein n=1 Tax=Streptomyces mangrovisoli TaxID=1428628 RepID=A0A1J4NUM4_9ACTN|nr:hypothetical protein WN71_026850 [Streptomyces mangrovisoli]